MIEFEDNTCRYLVVISDVNLFFLFIRWSLPDNMCLSNGMENQSRPNSASSSATSSSDSDYDHLGTKTSQVKCGYDKIDMSFILGDQEAAVEESAESEASQLMYRRQFRRQFGMTQAGSSWSKGQYFEGYKGQESSSDDDDDKVEVLYRAEETVNPIDMDTDEIEDDSKEVNGSNSEVEEEPEEMIVRDTSDEEKGGWITDEDETEQPPKRIKTSKGVESESDSNTGKKGSGSDDDEGSENGGGVDMTAFFDSNDPVYSYPSGPIKLSMEEIADYKQEECGGSQYYNFRSEDKGLDNYFESLAIRCESESDDDDDDFCMTCYSMSAGCSYAFPRVTPRRIELLIKFWEKDFQVGNYVYPKMGSWESKGIEPNRQINPASDCRKYGAYKALYTKWQECNKSREQWYRKYRGHSLADIANGRIDSFVQKQKTDSTFRSICQVDIAAQCRPQSYKHNGQRQRSNPHKRSNFGGFSRTVVY